jgi:hypothetical protein
VGLGITEVEASWVIVFSVMEMTAKRGPYNERWCILVRISQQERLLAADLNPKETEAGFREVVFLAAKLVPKMGFILSGDEH